MPKYSFFFFAAIMSLGSQLTASTIDQEYFDGVGGVAGGAIGQTFTCGLSGTLATVELALQATSSATLDIRPTSGGMPTTSQSSALAIVALPDLPYSANRIYDVDVSSFDVPVVPGEMLAFTLHGTSVQMVLNPGTAYGGGPDVYTRGEACIAYDANSPWNPYLGGGADLDFRTYVAVPEPSTFSLLGIAGLALLAVALLSRGRSPGLRRGVGTGVGTRTQGSEPGRS